MNGIHSMKLIFLDTTRPSLSRFYPIWPPSDPSLFPISTCYHFHRSTTATIDSIRFLRPVFSPITFAVPIKTTLRFNSEDVPDVDGSNTRASRVPGESLFVTSFEEDWPIEALTKKIPLVNHM